MSKYPARCLGEVLKKRQGRALGSEQLLSVTAKRGVIRQIEAGRRDISSYDKSSYRKVEPGDIVYNTMRMWQGVSGHSTHEGIVSPAYTVCIPNADADARFLAHLLRLPHLIQRFQNSSQGLVSDTWNLKYKDFARIEAPIPALQEQRKISEILDTMDKAILSMERLVDKLRTLTTGLRERLTWEGAQLSSLGTIIARGPQNGLYKPVTAYTLGTVDIVRIDSFDKGRVHAKDYLRSISATPAELERYRLRNGDILINRVNTPEIVGKVAIFEEGARPTVFESNIMRIRLATEIADPQFINLALCTNKAQAHFRSSAKSAISQASINQTDVRSCPIPQKPLEEQVRVVKEIDSANKRITVASTQVAKLQLVKAGLMEDLLTGRVRVRADD